MSLTPTNYDNPAMDEAQETSVTTFGVTQGLETDADPSIYDADRIERDRELLAACKISEITSLSVKGGMPPGDHCPLSPGNIQETLSPFVKGNYSDGKYVRAVEAAIETEMRNLHLPEMRSAFDQSREKVAEYTEQPKIDTGMKLG